MHIKGLLISLLVLSTVKVGLAQPLDAPEIQCISVLPNGNVEITWQQINDPNGQFSSYDLFNGAGALLTSQANIATTSHVHAGAGANLSSQSFSMQSVATNAANNSSVTQTVSTMYLQVNNPGNGTAWLTWNPISVPKLPGASDYYYIYKEYPAGVWTLLDSTMYGNESYIDTITICGDNINYRIEVPNGNCSSISNVDGGFFSDLIAPTIIPVNTVSVDTSNGNSNIFWDENPSEDTEAYVVFYFDGAGWVIIDTVWGYNNTSFAHAGNANNQSMSYGIAAFDSCWSGGSPNTSAMGQFHESIYLQTSPIICDYGMSLSWNDYQFWPSNVDYYEVFAEENGGPAVSLGTTNSLNMDVVALNSGSNYCFTVKAVSANGRVSLSNKTCVTINGPIQPTTGYLTTATVQGDAILVKYEGDATASLQAILIQRGNSAVGPFSTIATTAVTGAITTYMDGTVDPSQNSYYYRVIALDTCGNESIISNIGKNMVCEATHDDYEHKNTITWNDYEDWAGNIKDYEVYRSINGVIEPTPLAVLNPSAYILEDDVSGLLDTDGEFCYYIKAVEEFNPSGANEVSHSNVACVYAQSLVWVPNAIVINGANPVFKPVMSYFDIGSYQLTIFDRWGNQVFNSTSLDEGWDGKDLRNGDYVPTGVYVYFIEYTNSYGEYRDKKGSVTVLR
jgi:gliding motility-associated-like protein